MVRMVRMVRSLADRTFQFRPLGPRAGAAPRHHRRAGVRERRRAARGGGARRTARGLVGRFDIKPYSDYQPNDQTL